MATGDTNLTNLIASGTLKGAVDYVVMHQRHHVTTAEVNAGHSLVAVPAGYKFRLVDCAMIAIGGAAAGTTTVDLLDGATKLVENAVAGLTQSALLRAGATNSTILADGASFEACPAGNDITIGKTGGDLITATHIDVLLSYVLEQ